MSKKTEKTFETTNLVTSNHVASLNAKGEEMPSDVSLVTVAHRRPVTLGERIRRYTSLPTLADTLLYDDIEDDDYVGDYDGPPMSPYEDRHRDLLKKVKERKTKERQQQIDDDIKKKAEETEKFQAAVALALKKGAEYKAPESFKKEEPVYPYPAPRSKKE